MELQMYSVFDEKARAYTTPMFFQNEAMAVREIGDVVNDGKSSLARHPGDYSLFRLGTVDMNTGLTMVEKVHIVDCIQLKENN